MHARLILPIVLGMMALSPGAYAQAPEPLLPPFSPASVSAAGDSFVTALSDDGRFVTFISRAPNLTTNDSDFLPDLFQLDRQTGKTILISGTEDGSSSGNEPAGGAVVSTDGRTVVFSSLASNLTPSDTNVFSDVYLKDFEDGSLTLLSRGAGEQTAGSRESIQPALSSDGRYAAFISAATNLIGGVELAGTNVFLHDRQAGGLALLSITPDGLPATNIACANVDVSDDGRFVVFGTTSAELAGPDTNETWDVILHDVQLAANHLVSINNEGTGAADGRSEHPVMTPDGRFVLFTSTANNLVEEQTGTRRRLFLRDTQTGETQLVSQDASGGFTNLTVSAGGYVMTPDARLVILTMGHGVSAPTLFAWEPSTRELVLVGADNREPEWISYHSHSPRVTADGRFVVFVSNATNLVSGATTPVYRIYQRDMADGTVELVSRRLDDSPNEDDSDGPLMTADGRVVAFHSRDDRLVPDDHNGAYDVFVRDLDGGKTELVSRHATGLASAAPFATSALLPDSLSADGRYLTFISSGEGLVPQDRNGLPDIYLRDLWSGGNILVSANVDRTGAGNDRSVGAVISGDGRYVAFLSYAWDLVSGYSFSPPNAGHALYVYLYDVAAGTTRLVTKRRDSSQSIGIYTEHLSFSNVGNLLAFGAHRCSFDELFHSSPWVQLHQYDTALDTTRLLTTRAGSTGCVMGDSTIPVFTPDGRWIVFQSTAGNLVNFSANLTPHLVFARRSTLAPTQLLNTSLSNGWSSASADSFHVSRNSRFVVYTQPGDPPNEDLSEIYRYDLETQERILVHANGSSPTLTADGRYCAFVDPGGSLPQLVVRDLIEATNRILVTHSESGLPAADYFNSPRITPGGRHVAFRSRARVPAAGDTNSSSDVFVHDLRTDETFLLSAGPGGASANRLSANFVLGSDGRTVLFESYASDLSANDFNGARDIFLARLPGEDSDGDGLDDDWEIAHFGDLGRDGTGDFDEDGFSDLAEFKAGTSPLNTASLLQVIEVGSIASDSVMVLWAAVPGRIYRVQFKHSLNEAGWEDLEGDVIASHSTASKVHDTGGQLGQNYYRVMLVE